MGLIKKEKRAYLEGMQFAVKIASLYGIEYASKEVKIRSNNIDMPLNVCSNEITAAARKRSKEELSIIATAMADTMVVDMKLPPSVIVDFLLKFNNKCDLYREDKEAFEKAMKKLDNQYSLNDAVRKFMEE